MVDGLDWTPITYAINVGNIKMINLLFEKGANPNLSSEESHSPLNSAIYEGKKEIVTLLIQNGANVNLVDGVSWSPISVAVERNNIEILEILIDRGGNLNTTMNGSSNRTLLNFAIEIGSQEIVRTMMENDADVNITENDGWTPLCFSFFKDKIEIQK